MASLLPISDLDFLDHGLGDFDVDIIDDPFHPKRYRILQNKISTIALGELDADNDQHYLTRWRDRILLFIAVLISIAVYISLAIWHSGPQIILSEPTIEIKLFPRDVEPKPIEANDDSKAEDVQPIPVDKVSEQNGIPRENSEEELITNQLPPIRDQIESVVRKSESEPKFVMPQLDGLSAPGVVFDNHLRDRLGSAEIQRLNRWRPPENGHIELGGEVSLTKIGDFCFLSGIAAQGGPLVELPLIGNGWNINFYKNVNCDTYFSAPELDRSNIKPK